MRKFLKYNGLTVALMLLFFVSLIGHWQMGARVENAELLRHGQAPISVWAYLADPEFLSTLFENWESEFLQMAAYVMLTAVLFQKGSAESKDPDKKSAKMGAVPSAIGRNAPAALRGGPAMRWFYARSLGLTLFALYLVSFTLHWLFSARAAAAQAAEHGQPGEGAWAYLLDPQLWFESFQNWQSEFLSAAVLVVLSIWLRQKDSPESKPVAAPHTQTGA